MHNDQPTDDEIAEAMQMASDAMGSMLEWVFQGGKAKKSGATVRTYALLYMANPSAFGNQTEYAESLGITKKVLNTSLASFRDTFGYSLPRMRPKETRQKYSDIKTAYHKQKGQTAIGDSIDYTTCAGLIPKNNQREEQ